MNLRVAMSCEVKGDDTPSRSESEREQRVLFVEGYGDHRDLHMSRMKSR